MRTGRFPVLKLLAGLTAAAAIAIVSGCERKSDAESDLNRAADALVDWHQHQMATEWASPDPDGLYALETRYAAARERAVAEGLITSTVVPWGPEHEEHVPAMQAALSTGAFKVHWRDPGAEDITIKWTWDPDSGERVGLQVWSARDGHDALVRRIERIRDAERDADDDPPGGSPAPAP